MIQGNYCSFSYPSRSSSSRERDLIPSTTSNVSGGSSWQEEGGLCLDPSIRGGNNEDERGDCSIVFEKEHMFEKVVTPSDVGKLNRLVIPKQHAEKYFPLDSSNCEKGLLLNFEDHSGKQWRFRYSYWSSSQSYVMTKGWSRFVKEMNLDAGDIVSFQRGVGELDKDRLFIDWRRRHHQPDPLPLSRDHLHSMPRQVSFGRSVPWDSPTSQDNQWFSRTSNGVHIPYRNNFSGAIGRSYNHRDMTMSVSRSNYGIYDMFYLNSSSKVPHTAKVEADTTGDAQPSDEIYESVTVTQVKAASRARKFRLFGVNMECTDNESSIDDDSQSPPPPDLMLYNGVPVTPTTRKISCRDKGSMSLDMDI